METEYCEQCGLVKGFKVDKNWQRCFTTGDHHWAKTTSVITCERCGQHLTKGHGSRCKGTGGNHYFKALPPK